MGIELKITAESVADLYDQMGLIFNGGSLLADAQPDPVAEAKPARTSRKKAEPKVEEAESPNAPTGSTEPNTQSSGTPSEPTESGEAAQEAEPTVTYVDVQKAVTQLAAAKGRDAVVVVFNKFGVDHGTKLKPEQWVDAVAELEAAKEAA